jgi:hypothetical protein
MKNKVTGHAWLLVWVMNTIPHIYKETGYRSSLIVGVGDEHHSSHI